LDARSADGIFLGEWLHNRGEHAINEWGLSRCDRFPARDKMFLEGMRFPARDGWLTVLSSFRTRGLDARSMAGWSFVADVSNRRISTTRRCNGRGQAAPMSAALADLPDSRIASSRRACFLGCGQGLDAVQWLLTGTMNFISYGYKSLECVEEWDFALRICPAFRGLLVAPSLLDVVKNMNSSFAKSWMISRKE